MNLTPRMDSPQSDQARWFADHLAPHDVALRAYLRGFTAPAEVDDIVQESYSRVLRARERGPVDSPRGLLFAVARNTARTLHRARTRADLAPLTDMVANRVSDDSPDAAETTCRRQEATLLEAAISDLPPRCREILLLRKFENLSHREIAARLSIAESTVEVQLAKGFRRVSEYFARYGAR